MHTLDAGSSGDIVNADGDSLIYWNIFANGNNRLYWALDFNVYAQQSASEVTPTDLPVYYTASTTSDTGNPTDFPTITVPTDGRLVKWAFNDGDANTATTYYFEMKNINVTAPSGYSIQIGGNKAPRIMAIVSHLILAVERQV